MKPTSFAWVASFLLEILAPCISHASGQLQVEEAGRVARSNTISDSGRKQTPEDDTAAHVVQRVYRGFDDNDIIPLARVNVEPKRPIEGFEEEAAIYTSRDEFDPERIKKGYYAHVVYSRRGEWNTAAGKIEDTFSDNFIIRSVSGFWMSWRIAHDEIETMVTYRNRRNIESWLQTRTAIVRFHETLLYVMTRDDIDQARLKKGAYATVFYSTERTMKTAFGKIADKDEDQIEIQSNPLMRWKITKGDIDMLVLGESRSDMDGWFREKYPAIRVKTGSISRRRITGRFFAVKGDTLIVVSDRGFERIHLSSIDDFEVSVGRYRNTGKGMLIGAALGLAILAPTALSQDDDYELQGLVNYGVTVSSLCVFIGSAIVGYAKKSNKWVDVSPIRLNLGIAPTQKGGVHTALSFDF